VRVKHVKLSAVKINYDIKKTLQLLGVAISYISLHTTCCFYIYTLHITDFDVKSFIFFKLFGVK